MGKNAVVLAWLLWAPLAAAQSRVDQVPESSPEPQLPLAPVPAEEVTDAPAHARSAPELVTPPSEPATRLVPGAPDSDSLGGHILPYALAGYTFGYGKLDAATPLRETLGAGATLAVGVGYGLSRNVELGVGAALGKLSAGSACSACSATEIDPQLYIGYHLVEGPRFDPWVRFGVGASILRVSGSGEDFNYYGVNWGTVMFGGDWFATNHIGFGPVFSFALQSYQHTPSSRSAALSERFVVGMRIVLDATGR